LRACPSDLERSKERDSDVGEERRSRQAGPNGTARAWLGPFGAITSLPKRAMKGERQTGRERDDGEAARQDRMGWLGCDQDRPRAIDAGPDLPKDTKGRVEIQP
jgi:hypothetical protein